MAKNKGDNHELPPGGQEAPAVIVEKPPEETPPQLSDEDKELKEYGESKGWMFNDNTKPMLKSMREEEKHLRGVEETSAVRLKKIGALEEKLDIDPETGEPKPKTVPQKTDWKDYSEKINKKINEDINAGQPIDVANIIVEVSGRMMGGLLAVNAKQQRAVNLQLFKLMPQHQDFFKKAGFETSVKKHLDNLPQHLQGDPKNIEDCIKLAKSERIDEIVDQGVKDKLDAEKKHRDLTGESPNFVSPVGTSLLKKKVELSPEEKKVAIQTGIGEEAFLKRKKERAEKKHLSGGVQKEEGW